MPRGYCPDCEELVEIVPGDRIDPKFSAHRWYPIPHFWPGTLTPCPGAKKPI